MAACLRRDLLPRNLVLSCLPSSVAPSILQSIMSDLSQTSRAPQMFTSSKLVVRAKAKAIGQKFGARLREGGSGHREFEREDDKDDHGEPIFLLPLT
jgi:hypothetical protein